MTSMRLTTQDPKPPHPPSQSQIWLDRPLACRFMLGSHGPESVSIYLIRLDDTPGARGLEGQAHIDAQGHILRVWSGPLALGSAILDELIGRLHQGFDATLSEIEAQILSAPTSAPTEACRTVAKETRALTTTTRKAVEEVANALASYTASSPLRDLGKDLHKIIAYAAEGYDTIASALDDLAADLNTCREQLITNLSAAVQLLTPAEDARIKGLATVQALHAEGRISDEAAAALNQALATPDSTEGT